MKAFKVVSVKEFMNQFLLENVFDNFLLVDLEIKKDISFSVNGEKNAAWFDNEEEKSGYVKWADVRPIASSLVKGSRAPLSIKAVLKLNDASTDKIVTECGGPAGQNAGLFLNISFENGVVTLTTGVSLADFMIQKTVGNLWDTDMSIFLKQKEIAFEEL